MRREALLPAAAAGLAAAVLLSVPAGAAEVSDYTIEQLLSPCVEADNDARWGAAAEAECEQYIRGFTDAYLLITDGGKADGICLPEQNRDDEIRWAFMKWAKQHYGQRGRPAAEGLMITLRTAFKCP